MCTEVKEEASVTRASKASIGEVDKDISSGQSCH